jgi:hypothetical protein
LCGLFVGLGCVLGALKFSVFLVHWRVCIVFAVCGGYA